MSGMDDLLTEQDKESRKTYQVQDVTPAKMKHDRELAAMEVRAAKYGAKRGSRVDIWKFFVPLILSAALVFLIVGPSVTIILSVISNMNPLVWIVGILVLIFFWRRFIS